MVATEEIVKGWMYSDRPVTHCLITGTLPKGYGHHPLCERRDSKMRVLVQTTTFLPLLWRANAVDEN